MSKFIASLAHDLKNSIGNSMMYSELLSSEIQDFIDSSGTSSNEVNNWLMMNENIRLSNSKLINQINSWVYAHHILSGKYEEEQTNFSLNDLIKSIVASNTLFITKKALQLEPDLGAREIFITTDREILHLILDNLLNQSIIFSNKADRIRFSIRENEEVIVIAIADSYSHSRPEIITRFLHEMEVTGDEVPSEGILKATGYGMIFSGLAIGELGATASVEDNDLGGVTFIITFKK
ncbi:MAG: hypothetical protein WDZ53_02395 [Balneolales bacterium]